MGVGIADVAADHGLDQLLLAGVGNVHGSNVFSVLQNDDAVGHLEDLRHAVRDVQDDFSLFLQFGNDPEQGRDLRVGKAGGRLVEADDGRVPAVRLHDLHHLLVGDAQAGHLGTRVHVKPEFIDDLLRVRVKGLPVDASVLLGQESGVDVLRHAEGGDHLPFLIDDADSGEDRLVRILEILLLSVQQIGTFCLLDVTGEDLQQRALSGAVFAHQGKDLAAFRPKADIVQRLDARIQLSYVFKLQRMCQYISLLCPETQASFPAVLA